MDRLPMRGVPRVEVNADTARVSEIRSCPGSPPPPLTEAQKKEKIAKGHASVVTFLAERLGKRSQLSSLRRPMDVTFENEPGQGPGVLREFFDAAFQCFHGAVGWIA